MRKSRFTTHPCLSPDAHKFNFRIPQNKTLKSIKQSFINPESIASYHELMKAKDLEVSTQLSPQANPKTEENRSRDNKSERMNWMKRDGELVFVRTTKNCVFIKKKKERPERTASENNTELKTPFFRITKSSLKPAFDCPYNISTILEKSQRKSPMLRQTKTKFEIKPRCKIDAGKKKRVESIFRPWSGYSACEEEELRMKGDNNFS